MNRTDVYQKYVVKRADGKEEPNAVYFVLRVDRVDHWWDQTCRWLIHRLASRLRSDGDPVKNKFGHELLNWVADPKL